MKNSFFIAFSVIFAGFASPATAMIKAEYQSGSREVLLENSHFKISVLDGAIVGLTAKNLTPQAWSKATNPTQVSRIPAGLGILVDLPNFRKGHIPWGEPRLNQHLSSDFPLTNYFRPEQQSKVELKGTQIHYRGLGNGKVFFPEAELTMDFREEADGTIAVKLSGAYPKGNVFGAILPFTGLPDNAEYIVPGFGGLGYFVDEVQGIIPFGSAPFTEAPLLLAENPAGSSFGVWMEDPSMRSYYTYLSGNGKTMSLALEVFSLMPFEKQTSVQTPEIRFGVFPGDWKNAAKPYRDFYQKHFASEIAVRDNVPWKKSIRAIVDIYMQIPSDEILQQVADTLGAPNVLFQIWNARAAAFDTDLPDWTPREGYVDGVKRIHQKEMRAMAYVNTYCANYLSPVWQRDKLSDFVLTRKLSPYTYLEGSDQLPSSVNEKLIGTVDRGSTTNQFEGIPAGRLLYTDPLSQRWRNYHAEMMRTWYAQTATDANYEDTAGCVTDSGNGIVDNLSAGEGAVAQMRLLQKTQPHIPMSSEYGPPGIAFGTSWALNYAGSWGNAKFRNARIHRQHPVMSYLFGYRQWIPSLNDLTELESHAMASTADATGGFGFIGVDFFRQPALAMQANRSWRGHFLERTELFCKKELDVFFPETDYPENIACMYKGNDGVYSYYDDGSLQQMLDPSGEVVYGRVNNVNRVKTKLKLANWPLQNGTEIFGLNPDAHYPLFRDLGAEKELPVTISDFPDQVMLQRFTINPDCVVLNFVALPGGPETLQCKVTVSPEFPVVKVNGENCDSAEISGKLPLTLIAMKPGFAGKIRDGGVFAGKDAKSVRGIALFRHNLGHAGFPLLVEDENMVLEVYFKNFQDKYPFHGYNGTRLNLLVDGHEVASFDCLPEPGKKAPDTGFYRWQLPLKGYANKQILITLEADDKNNYIQDAMYVSIPRLVKAEGAAATLPLTPELLSETLTPAETVMKPVAFHGGKIENGPDNSFRMTGAVRMSNDLVQIDPQSVYKLSGEFMTEEQDQPKSWVILGLAPFDAKTAAITPSQVNPIAGSLTELAEEAKIGDTQITVKDSSRWVHTAHTSVAFQCREDAGDLPNRNLIDIASVDGAVIKLKKPLDRAWTIGTPVRQHQSGNSYLYGGAYYEKLTPGVWTSFSGNIGGMAMQGAPKDCFWAGTDKVRILVMTNFKSLNFRNLKLEKMQ